MLASIFNFASRMLVSPVTATYVEGPITQDTIWTLVDSPFIVSKDITVYSNSTLTIEPGVEVKFGGNFSVTVSGKLYANGTSKTITFTSNKEQPESGDWNSIRFNGVQKSTLIGCSILYAQNGILIENGNVEIKSSAIGLCLYDGINITDGDAIIQNNLISENQGNGISVTGNGQVSIQNNMIMANGNGILLTGVDISNVNISQNKISANTQNGIQIDANIYTNISILNNTVSSNSNGFYISTLATAQITNNSISYNSIGFVYDLGNHVAKWNDIYGNEIGMDVLSDAIVNAEYNYWGDPSGPYHEMLNPNGRGNKVGGDGVNLDFIFFLTKPIGVINLHPTANLLTDKVCVSTNDSILFFAANSYDPDGRVDRYFFDFGDGSNSGWTTLSVFSHKYSSSGMYSANLSVMDDYGAVSNIVSVTVDVVGGSLPPLYVNVELSNSTVYEGEQILVTVHVTNGTTPVQDAIITLFSVKGGGFMEPTGDTNASGYFVTTFTAPDVTDIRNVRIVARASRNGIQYVDGSDYEYLQVLPFLSVQIDVNPNVVKSEETAQVTIYVKSNDQPVANASVTVLSDDGSLSSETGTSDSNGAFSIVFTAPRTTTISSVSITANATKDGYMHGVGQTLITVEPKIPVVELTATPNVTISEAKVNVTVHVEYEMTLIVGANVTIMADDGSFSTSTDLTDVYGNATFIFTTPPVNEQTDITITAYVTKLEYAEAQGQLEITVNPRTFSVQIITPNVKSEESAMITVFVICNEDAKSSVADATVLMSSTDGTFGVTSKTTDSTGACTFIFKAPKTTSDISVTVTANVTKNGYLSGGSQATITVSKATPTGDSGWLWILLLILIPVVIVIIVVVLIKLKVIAISSEEET